MVSSAILDFETWKFSYLTVITLGFLHPCTKFRENPTILCRVTAKTMFIQQGVSSLSCT